MQPEMLPHAHPGHLRRRTDHYPGLHHGHHADEQHQHIEYREAAREGGQRFGGGQWGHQAAQTRAALVEQQYSTLQQHHLSRSDLNYIQAATHPKNLQRQLQQQQLQQQQPNKIVIEIGLSNDSGPSSAPASSTLGSSSTGPRILQAAEALMEGNVDSISLPAAAPLTAATTSSAKSLETAKERYAA